MSSVHLRILVFLLISIAQVLIVTCQDGNSGKSILLLLVLTLWGIVCESVWGLHSEPISYFPWTTVEMFLITATILCLTSRFSCSLFTFLVQCFCLDRSNVFCKADNREVDYTGKDYKDFNMEFIVGKAALCVRTSVSDCWVMSLWNRALEGNKPLLLCCFSTLGTFIQLLYWLSEYAVCL